ncbi:MAG: M1 family metallopeptidase [Gaiellaceae bacterium]
MRKLLLRGAIVAGALVLVPASLGASFAPGSDGLGDPMYPLAGNGGYDVTSYSLTLDYTPSANRLVGTAVITARATQNLSRFDLDFRMQRSVTRVLVDGAPATFAVPQGRGEEQELVVTPAAGIVQGKTFTVRVDYDGTPVVVTDPDESIEGWVPTDDGAFVVNEPQGSPGWYPANDNPRDKATYNFRITVPAGLTAMANGVLDSWTTSAGKTTWVWRETDPMAPYLATATLGKFDLDISRVAGVPSYVAVDPQLAKGQVLSKLPEAVELYASIYGPYPFNSVGAIVDKAKVVGYSLETQTKPNFPYVPDEATLVHELSHMWFGDSLTLKTWPDIWLHEGFATWSEWIWSERQGNKSAHQWFEQLYNTPAKDTDFWEPAVADFTDPALLFNGTVYYRGGMTLQALREKIGDLAFFQLLRDWATKNRYGTVTTPQFIALAEKESGQDLTQFFNVWIFQAEKPAPGSW